jgi:peroxiredoxin
MRTAAAAVLLALAIPALAIPPVPRPSKEFTFVEPSGKQTLVSGLKGKVVIVQFLFTWCPHCQAFSKLLTTMQKDLTPKGVQIFGVSFDDNIAPAMASTYKEKYEVGFPIAYAQRDQVLSYLGISVMERMAVPQIVIIDKEGRIRAQSQPLGSPELQNEANLKKWLSDLAAEKPGAPATPLIPVTSASAK